VSSSVPVAVAGNRTFIAVSASHRHSCAIETEGALFCWGDNTLGQLGINSSAPAALVPTAVFAAQAWRQVSAGVEHTCAVDVFDEAYCWGSGSDGKLGNGGQASVRVPVPVSGGLAWRAVSAGGALTCGVTRAGVPYCWGSNLVGGLGNPATTLSVVPQAVQVAAGDTYRDIAAGESLACAVTATAGGRCWGNNPTGQLGIGTVNNALTPQAVSGALSWAVIAAAAESSFLGHGCGVTTGGAVACWGLGDQGQLGRAATTTCLIFTTWPCTLSPLVVPTVPPATRVAVGVRHSCALTRDGALWCWGANGQGQLGDGTTMGRSTPAPIQGALDLPRVP
jgi:alpha-tubulin suppressor-like RCC1 family protein